MISQGLPPVKRKTAIILKQQQALIITIYAEISCWYIELYLKTTANHQKTFKKQLLEPF
jgi:hypothetical protein